MNQIKIGLDWAFDARLESDQTRLIAELKPNVTAWVNAEMPVIHKQLKRALRNGMQASMITRMVRIGPVWMFNALIANRDIGTDVIAMVAASEDAANIMAESFMDTAEARMGPSQ